MKSAPFTYSSLSISAKTLQVSLLKKNGYLEPGKENRGILTWEKDGQTIAEITIYVNMLGSAPYLNLNYWYNDSEVTTRIALVAVPSNLGKGIVWRFIYPHTGLACLKLYECTGIFIHRSAIKGLYWNKTWSKTNRHILQNMTTTLKIKQKAENLQKKYAKQFYNGKPTKKYLALQKTIQKLHP